MRKDRVREYKNTEGKVTYRVIWPIREVISWRDVPGSRYTGWKSAAIEAELSCGHTVWRKRSQGIPNDGMLHCEDCRTMERF